MGTQENNRPQIEIFYADGLSGVQTLLKKIAEGIEEEGVPYHFSARCMTTGTLVQTAYEATLLSLLEVGIGLDQNGNLALHYRKLPDNEPLFVLNPPYNDSELRIFGSHAARLVKGLPFRLNAEDV